MHGGHQGRRYSECSRLLFPTVASPCDQGAMSSGCQVTQVPCCFPMAQVQCDPGAMPLPAWHVCCPPETLSTASCLLLCISLFCTYVCECCPPQTFHKQIFFLMLSIIVSIIGSLCASSIIGSLFARVLSPENLTPAKALSQVILLL